MKLTRLVCITVFQVLIGITAGFAQRTDSVKKSDSVQVVKLDSTQSVQDTIPVVRDTVPVVKMEKIAIDAYHIPMVQNPVSYQVSEPSMSMLKLRPNIIDSKINYWQTKTSIGINLNQSSFSGNWKAGGVNSVAIGGLIGYKADYNKGNFNFLHETNMQYGKLKNRGQLERKTVDRMFIDNKLSFQISKNWSFFSSLTFESQFDNGFSYQTIDGVERPLVISRFMSPGYLTESLGIEYKPTKYFNLRFGTGTARQTFVLDTTLYRNTPSNYGVEIGKKSRNEMAFQITADFDKQVAKNVGLKWRYWMFVPYQMKTFADIKQRFDATLTMKVNYFMNVNLNGTILYDIDQDVSVQTSQALAVGIMLILPR